MSQSLLIGVLALGALLAPVGIAASLTPRWANRFLFAGLACGGGLFWVILHAQDDDYTRVVSERRAEVQRVERSEPRAFLAGFQEVLLDGRVYAVTDEIRLAEKQLVTVRVVQHKFFADTRVFVCVEGVCSAAQPVEG